MPLTGARPPRTPRLCDCGSGLVGWPRFSARNVYVLTACPRCEDDRLARYPSDTWTNPRARLVPILVPGRP